MSDHQSFLKLLGMETVASSEPPEASASDSDQTPEWSGLKSVVEKINLNDLGPLEEAVPEEFHAVDTNNQEEPEEKTELVSSEEFDSFNSARFEEDDLGLYEKTEILSDQPVDAESSMDREYTQKTGFSRTVPYTGEEVDFVSSAAGVVEVSEGTERFNSEAEENINGELDQGGDHIDIPTQEDQVFTDDEKRTQGTLPFDYEAGEAGGENKTMHFDYEEDKQGNRLVILDGKSLSGKALYLNDLPLKIGRDSKNHLILDDVNSSRFHAEIQDQQGLLVAVDLGSTNGLKVNGLLVSEKVLEPHDVIQIGDCLIEFVPTGELSKGKPQTPVLQETASAAPASKHKNRRLMIALLLFGLGAGLFLFMKSGGLKEKAIEMASEKTQGELQSLKQELETKYQKTLEEIPSLEVKRFFISRMQDSAIGKLMPESLKTQMDQLAPDTVKIILDDDQMVPRIMATAGDPKKLELLFRDKLNELLIQKKYGLALGLAQSLSSANPDNKSLRDAVAHLQDLVGVKNQQISSGIQTEDEKKFSEYVVLYDKKYESHIREKEFRKALDFARLIREKIGDLLRMEPVFEKMGRPEAEKWDARIANLEVQVRDVEDKELKNDEIEKKADEKLREIQLVLNTGDAKRAYSLIAEFKKQHSESILMKEVRLLEETLDENMNASFRSVRDDIDRNIQTESFELAWKGIYAFLDMSPNHKEALATKDRLLKLTQPKAIQYYNQARVYEFEADDLIAAEQYYKRAMEHADPRSDLFAKSSRRHNDVKRKLIR